MNNERAAERCIYAAGVVAVLITVLFWGTWMVVVLAWIGVIPLAMFFGLVVGFVGAAFSRDVVSSAPESKVQDPENPIIRTSEKVIGRYKDEDIFEWVLVQHDDEQTWCEFSGTVDLDTYDFVGPEGKLSCVTAAGVIYTEPEQKMSNTEIS